MKKRKPAPRGSALALGRKKKRGTTCWCDAYKFPHRVSSGECLREYGDECGARDDDATSSRERDTYYEDMARDWSIEKDAQVREMNRRTGRY